MSSRLLVLSNGHGEDLIAQRVLQALRQRRPDLIVRVLPLVGLGEAFAADEAAGHLQRLGPQLQLPSGGFSNQSLRGLARDLAAGLPLLSWRQLRLVRVWARQGDPVLAVGDLLPLLLAWSSGGRFGFIGTPKSDCTWASSGPPGWRPSPLADAYHRCKGSEWDPWEWAVMGSRRCRLVAVRDRLTARGLRRHGVAALAPGNPMMDGFPHAPLPAWLQSQRRLILLAGSRLPESLANARRLLGCLALGQPPDPAVVLVASGSAPSAAAWAQLLKSGGFTPMPLSAEAAAIGASASWGRGRWQLLLGQHSFSRWASWAELGLATAGTATEQLAGLGVPSLSLPGPGPQFKAGFARRQSRLLGGAVQPCQSPEHLVRRLQELLEDPHERARRAAWGRRRMGPAGGSARLAALVEQRLLG
ncbi:lipid-A-disaccharide synthase-related protein [Cyanobium sp. Alchichica 3B3-8F6]|uniref:lipid-A-disaccharide synthase-related protein n=1 Tax=Cyanobium sp. Alchichica 3B3-8F6 TaxID=2823696 RepID=UPI0020CB94E0|nr:lipid-A-disaccharide synthase-related protein [Cyanobium sp. Alchichica 3B3-8F6]MCP9882832.1 lipid-A-disaccharide synthase-related protein [Cyanobium sp. Alchichica 3B3-8F6]